MVALPLCILALAAGVYLLVKVKREFLGGIFEILAWLVIVLSLAATGFAATRAIHNCCGRSCDNAGKQHCNIEKRVIIKGGEPGAHCQVNPHCAMGCKIEGDSVVLEQSMCEGIVGKEACEKIRTERGRCILSKDECKKACAAAGKTCCAEGPAMQGASACGHGKGSEEKKACCAHK